MDETEMPQKRLSRAEPTKLNEHNQPIRDKTRPALTEATNQDPPTSANKQPAEEKTAEGQQKEKHTTHKEKITRNGFMTSLGKPRQPRTTQENKTGTLRYEQETETRHCAKCGKIYSRHNARSARNHEAEHTKAEKQQKAKEEVLLHRLTQQNQDAIRLRTLRHYGQEHRGKEQPEQEEQVTTANNEYNKNIRTPKGKYMKNQATSN